VCSSLKETVILLNAIAKKSNNAIEIPTNKLLKPIKILQSTVKPTTLFELSAQPAKEAKELITLETKCKKYYVILQKVSLF